MLKYFLNLKKPNNLVINLISKVFMMSIFAFSILLADLPNVYGQNSKQSSNNNTLNDEKKYDLLKSSQETVWTCENNVVVKTSHITNGYLLLFNKKLFTMTGIEALNGVSHFTDMVHKFDWFIIPGKAMLFDSKAGQRLLDYCQTPEMKNVKLPESNLMK